MAAAEERQAFAKQLTEVRALDIEGKYKNNLDELELEYQFILLRSLDRFHNEMKGAHMLARLDTIKEELTNTVENNTYPPNRVLTGFNNDIKICRHCNMQTLKPRPFSHELCCENCGLLEPLDGVTLDYSDLYQYGDYKVVKRRRTNRTYNFRYYLDKHLKICATRGHHLSDETRQRANETFKAIEYHLPKRISMPFVMYKILNEIVPQGQEHYLVNYSWLQVPQGSVEKHEEKWQDMLRQFDGA